MSLMNWTDCDLAIAGHAQSIAKVDATGWMWSAAVGRSPRARLAAVLIALGTRLAPATPGMGARGHTVVSAEQS